MSNHIKLPQSKNPLFKLLYISLLIILTVSAVIYIQNEINSEKRVLKNELQAIARLKIDDISEWYNDQLYDTKLLSEGNLRQIFFKRWLEKKLSEDSLNICYNLLINKKLHRLQNILLADTNGIILLSAVPDSAQTDVVFRQKIKECAMKRQVISSDLYSCKVHRQIHIDFMSPVYDDNQNILAVLVCRVSPDSFLYPVLSKWPVPCKSSETLIARADGDSVVFLNRLRFNEDAALKIKFPLSNMKLPAVRALRGQTGMFEGKDYRGVKVIAYLAQIPGTSWVMVAKTDRKELYNDVYNELALLIVLFAVLFGFIVFTGFFIIKSRQAGIYRKLYTTQGEFKATLYSIGDAVMVVNKDGFIEIMNPEAERITGYSEQEAIGRQLPEIFRIISEETRQEVENPIVRVKREGSVVGLANHTLLISRDGNEIPIADSGAPVKDENGNMTGIILVFRDQTDERRLQKAVEESEEKYRSLFESTNDGICLHEIVYNEQGEAVNYRILDVNRKYEELLNLKASEVVGKLGTEAYQTEEPPYFETYLKVARTADPYHFETFFEPLNKYFSISVFCPAPDRFATVFQDITIRKQAELALKESEEFLKTTIYSIGEGVIITDEKGLVTRLNEEAARLTGYSEKEARHKHLRTVFRIINEENRQEVESPFDKVIREGTVVGLANHTLLISRAGKEIPIADSGAPIKDENGNILGVILVFRDQTKERLAQKMMDIRLRLFEYAAHHNVEETCTKMLDETVNLVDSKIGFYHFVAEDEQHLQLQAWSTQTKEKFCKAEGSGLHYNINEAGVWVDCIRERRSIIHNDYQSLPNKKGMPEGHAEVIRELVVPVFRNNKIVAVLGVGNKAADYTQNDLEIVEYMADVLYEVVNQKRMAELLSENEERFSKAFHGSPLPGAMIDMQNMQFVDVNDALLNALNMKKEAIIGFNVKDVPFFNLSDEVKEQHFRHFEELRQKGYSLNFPFVIESKDHGMSREFIMFSSLLQAGGKKLVLSYMVDITEKRKMEKELREKLDELQRWYSVTVGRENRNIELKKEVNELLTKLGQPPKYKEI
ncbi:MAG TPA: PAS domain S-box protein [Bacteroidia bacterium]|nr:PAS domain S-box protein [Bacteroidia bacterium]HRS57825.1 PAS domain S-box protein [Bacteroidia bacterium]HRU67875.1 PAS domain S-box protein [Bacteroidia bacterium]